MARRKAVCLGTSTTERVRIMKDACRKVIDLKTRQPFKIEQHEPTEQERQAAFVTLCADSIYMTAIKVRAVSGLDMALRVLHQIADDLRNKGKN